MSEVPKESNDRPAEGEPSVPAKAVSSPGMKETADGTKLTPEEQMALYEKDLKENDWGHQPC